LVLEYDLVRAPARDYTALADQTEKQRRKSQDIARFMRLGIAVQEAVRAALEGCGLKLTLVDRGFDYEVAAPADDVLEDLAAKVEMVSEFTLDASTGGSTVPFTVDTVVPATVYDATFPFCSP
jgi:hypothetical protein